MDSRAGRRSASCRPGAAGQVGTPLSGRWQRPRGRATCCPSAGGDVPGRPGSSTLTATNPDSWPAWRSPRAVAPDSGSRGRGGGLAASLLPAAAASGTGPAAGEPREPGDGGPRPRQGGSRTPRRRGRQEPLPVPLQRPTARGALRCGRRARAAQLSATSSAFFPGGAWEGDEGVRGGYLQAAEPDAAGAPPGAWPSVLEAARLRPAWASAAPGWSFRA